MQKFLKMLYVGKRWLIASHRVIDPDFGLRRIPGHQLKENHGVYRKRADLFENFIISESNDLDELHLAGIRTESIANRRLPIPLKFRGSLRQL